MNTTLLLLLGLLVIQARATERFWTGDGGNNLWSNPNNWSPSGVPQDGDELRFEKLCAFPVCPSVTVVNDLNNLRVGQLNFGGISGPVTYVVNGNPLRLTDSVLIGAVHHDSKTASVTLNCGLVLEANARFQVSYGSDDENRLFLNGPINLNGFNLTIVLFRNLGNWRSRVDIAGAISGTGNVTLAPQDTCTVEFNGGADNTFTGTLTLVGEQGEELFRLNKTGGAVTHGRMVIGGICRWYRPNQIGDESTVQVTDGEGFRAGKLYFQGHNETIQNLEMVESTQSDEPNNGLLDTEGGTLTVLNRISTVADGGTPIIRGQLAVPTSLTCDIGGSEFYGLDIQAVISGAGDLTKTGTAALKLSGNSTFTGWVFVSSGAVEPTHVKGFGSVNRGVSLRGGTVRLNDLAISGESLYAIGDVATLFALGTSTWAGEIRLERRLQVYGENLTLAHAITGPGGLLLFGGTITLASIEQNTFTGATEVRCELLRLNKPSNVRAFSGSLVVGGSASPLHEVRWLNNFQLPPAAGITVNDNGLLSLNDFTDAVANLTFNGGHANLATDSALTITGTVTSNPTSVTALIDGATGNGSLFLSGQRTFNIGDGSVAGPDLQINARIAGSGLTKTGAGTLALGGNNAFAGTVIISNGILRVDHDNALGTIGNGTTVNNGATLSIGHAPDLVREPVVLNGTGFGGTNGALAAAGAVGLSNNVTLASASTIRVDSPWQFTINGVISGTGPLTKIGTGTLTLAGGAANTFSGNTLVNGGALQLDKSDFTQAVPGNLVIGTGGFFPVAATVRHFSQDQIWANVTVNAGSLLDLNGYEEYLLRLALNGGGDVQTGAGLLTVDGGNSITVNPGIGSATSTISGRLGLRLGNHHIAVGSFLLPLIGSGPELDVPAQVLFFNGIANLHKSGSGEMRLSGANNFIGVLYVNGGSVIAANNSALGTTQGSTVVQTNGTLVLEGGITTSEFLILDTAAPVALSSISGSNTVTTNINLLRPGIGIEVQPAAGILQLRGRVGSVGGLTKLGPGTLQFFGTVANDYAGLTVISNGVIEASRGTILGQSFPSIPGDLVVGDDGTATSTAILRLFQPGQVKPGADATLHRSGLLDVVPRGILPNTSARLRRVTGAGRINLGANTSLIISNDVSFDFDGSISGTGALNKYGLNSSMHFTGASSFSGPTTIFEGFYRMDGSAPNSPLTIKPDGSLRGDGQVGGLTVEQDGEVRPNSAVPGHLGADLQMSSANFLAGGILGLNLYGPHPTGGNDSLLVNGPVTLGGTRLSSGFQYAPREGDVITLIRKTTAGPIGGGFTGYPEGVQRLHGEIPVVMSYLGGDGNDVTLTVTNLAAGASGSQVVSGNGNGLIEPDECNLLFLGVQNRRNTAITLNNVLLRSTTPGALVTIAEADYPVIPATSIRTNLTPFQLRTLPSFVCGTPVTVELQVTVAAEGTFAIPFTLLGGASCTNGGGACESCTIVGGTFAIDTPVLVRRLRAAGDPSICFPEKPCPGPDDSTNLPPARYLKHAFTNTTGSEACITAQLHFDCPTASVGTLHVAAYLGDVDSSSPCVNHLGDTGAGFPDAYPPFSFRVPGGSNFVVIVTTRVENIGCDSYGIELFGLPCPPPRLQIAKDAVPDKVLLQWSTAYPDWRLQTTNTLRSPGPTAFANIATTPAIVDGKFTVTNAVAQAKEFFRLQR